MSDLVTQVLQALGGLGLFLLGTGLMTDGLREFAGDALRRVLSRFTRSPLSGVVTGAVATAIVQSSSATTVAAVGFVSAGLLSFPQALGITLGANVGTTLKGWIVALVGFKLELGTASMPLLVAGALMRLMGRPRLHGLGGALAGFALIFVGLSFLQQGMGGLAEGFTPDRFPPDTLLGRLQMALVGVAMTVVTQSSSAGVATALTALNVGALSFPQAAAMVIGMDVGTTVTSALATIGGGPATKRTGFAHVVYNLMTGVVAFFLLDVYVWAMDALAPGALTREPELSLVGFHTAFNLVLVIAVIPLVPAFARLMERLFPEREPTLTRALDRRLLSDPAAAIDAAERATREVCGAALGLAEGLAAGARKDAARSRALRRSGELLAAVGELREYTARVRTTPDEGPLNLRHLDVMHAADHADRLADRCRQLERPQAVAQEPALTELGGALRDAIEPVRAALEAGVPPTLDALGALDRERHRLRDARHEERARALRAAAAQELSPEQALARLDAVRWLHRVSYHAWRIAWHLAPADARPAAPPDRGDAEG